MKAQKGTSLGGIASFELSTMEIGLPVSTCGGEEENNMKGREKE
jgi:hypothetical protein